MNQKDQSKAKIDFDNVNSPEKVKAGQIDRLSLLAKASLMFKEGNYFEALLEFKEFVRQEKFPPLSIIYTIGLCYMHLGDREFAIKIFEGMGDDPDAQLTIGLLDHSRAHLILSTLKKKPSNIYGLLGFCEVLLHRSDIKDNLPKGLRIADFAIQNLSILAESNSQNLKDILAQFYIVRGRYHEKLRDNAHSYADFKKSVDVKYENNPLGHFHLGQAMMNQPDDASKHLELALEQTKAEKYILRHPHEDRTIDIKL